MWPGFTTKLSEESLAVATTMYPKKDIIILSSTAVTTVIETLSPAFGGGFSGITVLINRSGGNVTTVTTGNILTAVTVGQNVATVFIYSLTLGKFVPGALA